MKGRMPLTKYKVSNIKIYDSISMKRVDQYFISMYDENTPGLLIPSIFTSFILKYARSANSQRSLANTIVPFLNYLIQQVFEEVPLFLPLKASGISGLNLYHLAQYLNYISNNPENQILRDTVETKEDTLVRLLYFLSDTGTNKMNDEILIKTREINNALVGTRRKRTSPFDLLSDIYIHYPAKNYKKKTILKDMKEELWDLMIEYAEEYYTIISFGILLMICSGLRRGECVNLRVKDVRYDKVSDRIYINVQDNQEELFHDRNIDLSNSQVKKPRKKQPLLQLHSRIEELYTRHKERLKIMYNTSHIADKPLFVNADGNAMSGNSFSNYFISFKNDFLTFLREEGFKELADELDCYKWGAHVGRHIFTNAIVKKGYANGGTDRPIPRLVALLRGDSSEEASMGYIDEMTISTAIQENMNEISRTAAWYGGQLNDKG